MDLAEKAVQLGQMGAGVNDWEIVNLLFGNSVPDAEIVWMVSYYVLYVWEMVHVKRLEV